MVPDRAPTRSLAADSVLKILAVLYKAVEGLAGQPQLSGRTFLFHYCVSWCLLTFLLYIAAPRRSSSTSARSVATASNTTLYNDELHVLSHFLAFLIRLSKCNKTGYRAFSLDIITAALATDWIWNLASFNTTKTLTGSASSAHGDEASLYIDPTFLLTTLMERCMDVAPTVRIRAVSTLCGLFETLSDSSPPEKCELLLQAAIGSLSKGNEVTSTTPSARPRSESTGSNDAMEQDDDADEEEGRPKGTSRRLYDTPQHNRQSLGVGTGTHKSLLDIFRESCGDEKPLVRSKSVQALGSALALQWPKFTNTSSSTTSLGQVEYITMFVSEDDLAVLIEKCNDSSLAVRKQAVIALTDLAKLRASDSSVQDAWVGAVLPMITDPESSVQMKVATSVQALILDTSIAWSHDLIALLKQDKIKKQQLFSGELHSSYIQKLLLNTGSGKGHNYDSMVNHKSAVAWRLLSRIALTGHTKMLKSCISMLFKYNAIPSSEVKAYVRNVSEAAKLACCLRLQIDDTQTEGHNYDPSEDELKMISSAGWVLLEAIVAQEKASSGDMRQYHAALDQTSADFIVNCFIHKRGHNSDPSLIDEDDVRMLQVLDKLASSLKASDIANMSQYLRPLLGSLALSTDAISAGISVMYTMSQVKGASEGDEDVGEGEQNELENKRHTGNKKHNDIPIPTEWCDDVCQWSGPLMSTAFAVLESYVQRTPIDAPTAASTPSSSPRSQPKPGGYRGKVSVPSSIDGLAAAELTTAMVHTLNHQGTLYHTHI